MVTGTPLKSSIARDRVLKWIREGRLAPGHRLPAEPALARMMNLHHTTVRRGLAELQREGIIEKRHRVGNFVKGGKLSLMQDQIAVVLQRWNTDQSPHRAEASLTMAELDDVIDRASYSLTMLTYGSILSEGPNSIEDILLRTGVKGVLINADDTPEHLPALQRLLAAGIKIAVLNHATAWDKLGLFSVKYDAAGALREIFRKFFHLGHRRIAVALDPDWAPAFHDSYRSCIESLFEEHGLGSLEEMVVYPKWDSVAFERQSSCLELLFERREPPTAIVVSDETFAMGVLRFCYRRGIRIPEDLSLASVQNYSPHVHPIPVSSPSSDALLRRGVRAAARHLLALLAGEQPAEREISLRCSIKWTESVGPAPRVASEAAVN